MLEMVIDKTSGQRILAATHGRQRTREAPAHERELVLEFIQSYSQSERIDCYARFATGAGRFDALMRRVLVAASAQGWGPGLWVDSGFSFRHIETVSFGNDVYIGTQAVIQGRFDGTCTIGSNTWIGAQVFLDARDLQIGSNVGLGPGCRILGSSHTGEPVDRPIIQTDLSVLPVRIEDDADIGINAVILPGVTVGRGSIIGAGAVVTVDVPPFSVVAGVPARVIRYRVSDSGAAGIKQGE